MDVEYISLHRYIRNTPSDTKVYAEHELELTGIPDQQKRIYRTMQNSVGQRKWGGNGEGDRSVSRTGPALGRWGN